MKSQALQGIRVVEIGWLITVPIATKFLADHGAEVIKVEWKARPDEMRAAAPFKDKTPGVNRSGAYNLLNNGKLSITPNLNNPIGLDIVRRLIARADVVIDSFRPGTLARWGLDYKGLKEIKPDIIALSMTMQGQSGRFCRQPGLGTAFQSALGFTDIVGWPDREPSGTVIPYPDFITPWFVIIVIMSALDYRRRTGKGQYVDMSQLETSLHFLTPALLDYVANGRIQSRNGNHCPYASPHGVYRCRGEDSWCAIAVFNDEQWNALCQVIGKPELSKDERFATMLRRQQNEKELDSLIEGWTCNYPAREVMEQMQKAGVPAGVVQNAQDLLDHDPQLKHRNFFRILRHSEVGSYTGQAPPFILSKTPSEMKMGAPCLGEHNEYVCTRILGMTDEDFVEALQSGAFD